MRIRRGHDRRENLPQDAPPGDPALSDPASRLLAVAWAAFQPRTVQLAAELDGESVFISSPRLAGSVALLPLRYLSSAFRTWRLLERHRPRGVLVITPPVVAPLVCWLWCALRRRQLVIDCHTGAFHSRRWAWARPFHRLVLRQARAVLVHTDDALALLRSWRAAGLLVPDDLPQPGDPQIMNRAAFEAVGLGRPLVLSDLPGLRARFGKAAVFSPNRPREMAEALWQALREQAELASKSEELAVDLREQRRRALHQLSVRLEGGPSPLSNAGKGPAESESSRPDGGVLMVSQHSFAEDVILRRNVFELLDGGLEVDVICSAGISGVQRAEARPGLQVRWVPIRHRRRPFLRHLWEYAAFFAAALILATGLALRRRYSAVQVDNLPDFLVFAAVAARLRGARVVFNMLELTPEMVEGQFGMRSPPALLRLVRWLEAAATGWADHVIVVSEECRRRVLKRGVRPEKVTVVLNTTATPPGDPASARSAGGESARRPYVVTHTTLIERYGVHLVIQAFASLQRRWPELTLRVIGDGEERSALERLAADLGLRERVVFTGFLPWTDTMAQVRRAVVGIVAVIADGYGELLLPTKLLEYARFRVPTVCSRLPVVEEYFPPDSVAYFAAGEASQLATQLDLLLSNPARARARAEQAHEVARELGWERVRGDYLKSLGLVGAPGHALAVAPAWEERPA